MAQKTLVQNKKAFHDFEIFDRIEAGVELLGTEVKSLKNAKANLTDGWIDLESGEAFLKDAHISHYSHGNIMNHSETRPRKLLLKHAEIDRLKQKVAEKGLTLIPLKFYLKGHLIKVEIALARGKKLYDKREASKQKDANKQIQRAIRNR